MALHVFDDTQQGASFIVCIVSTPICILATILRFVATSHSGRKIGLEDWFALLGLFFFLLYTAMLLWILVAMDGRNWSQAGEIPYDTLTKISKVWYCMDPNFSVNQAFVKLSLLALYYRLFSINRIFVRWVYTIGIIQIFWLIAMWFVRWFSCTPVKKIWEPMTPGHCINVQALLPAGESINSVIDFAVVGLAVYMVQSLKIATRTKWKLGILFALGSISGIIGFIKIGVAFGTIGLSIVNTIWIEVQMATSIVCCCAPVDMSLLVQARLFQRLKLRFPPSFPSLSKTSKDSKGPSIKGKASSENELAQRMDWSYLDTSNSRELAWVEVETGRSSRSQERAMWESSNQLYPMKTVRIHQTFEKI
ncbi:Satratoxin biosynthesis SC1 cluster protein 4 [Cladobotryum mycophilum]|uniref:Satratoxin biosynthesis SC1 cluster protein 4 n=1 Tax=Cladobotryum mycophilum TaxID=491253 RepID=A0ABR0SBZ5_9HYPO